MTHRVPQTSCSKPPLSSCARASCTEILTTSRGSPHVDFDDRSKPHPSLDVDSKFRAEANSNLLVDSNFRAEANSKAYDSVSHGDWSRRQCYSCLEATQVSAISTREAAAQLWSGCRVEGQYVGGWRWVVGVRVTRCTDLFGSTSVPMSYLPSVLLSTRSSPDSSEILADS